MERSPQSSFSSGCAAGQTLGSEEGAQLKVEWRETPASLGSSGPGESIPWHVVG